MIENFFTVTLTIFAIYAGCGVVVAALFLTLWYKRFDPSAAEGSWGFRVVVLPGLVALWPVILLKVIAVSRSGSAEGDAERPIGAEALRRNHGLAFAALAIAVPLLFAAALVWHTPRLENAPTVKIADNPAR